MRGLARHLTYDHFRTLFSAKDSSVVDNLDYSFHYDIIAELPVEISQKIFLYLPLYQCFRAQRVSRDWRKLLSAPKTIECLLRWWYPRGETDLCIPTDLSVEAVMNLKAEHVDAFRTGHPFSMTTLAGVPDCSPVPPVGGIAYAHGVLAWINPRSIETLDLRTHLRRHFIAEDRTLFRIIAISSSIIAALDLIGRCHVWDINNSKKRYLLQLPSARYDRMEASGPTLAIASSGQNMDGKIEVFTWSSHSLKTQSFLLPLHPVQPGLCGEWKMMLDPKGESLFLFQKIVSMRNGASDSQPNQRDNLYFTRTRLDGQICAQGRSEFLLSIYRVIAGSNYLSEKIRPVEVNGSATLWLFYSSLSDFRPFKYDTRGTRSSILIRISFNFERTSFEVEKRILANRRFYHNLNPRPLIWKDIIYWGDPTDAGTRIFDFKESTCEKTKLASNSPIEFGDNEIWSNNFVNPEGQLSLGDEIFLIHMGPKGWKVWCFDKNIQMANEDLEYGCTRSKNSQKHILPGVSSELC